MAKIIDARVGREAARTAGRSVLRVWRRNNLRAVRRVAKASVLVRLASVLRNPFLGFGLLGLLMIPRTLREAQRLRGAVRVLADVHGFRSE